MLRSLFGGSKWKTSNSHLLLLSKFLSPRELRAFSQHANAQWEMVLGEPVHKAEKKFVQDNMIGQVGPIETLEGLYKVTDLKKMLKDRGLKVSGKKRELAERLVQADPQGVKSLIGQHKVYICTEGGRAIAGAYLDEKRKKKELTEAKVYELLKKKKFKQASVVVASYEADQVFPRGMGIDWNKYDSSRDVKLLKYIFTKKPKILGQLDNDMWEYLRLTASMMLLWGVGRMQKSWPIKRTELAPYNDSEIAARMIEFHAIHLVNIDEMKKSRVIKTVKTLTANDDVSCENCKELARKEFSPNKLPELPYPRCTCEYGCRCTAVASQFR